MRRDWIFAVCFVIASWLVTPMISLFSNSFSATLSYVRMQMRLTHNLNAKHVGRNSSTYAPMYDFISLGDALQVNDDSSTVNNAEGA